MSNKLKKKPAWSAAEIAADRLRARGSVGSARPKRGRGLAPVARLPFSARAPKPAAEPPAKARAGRLCELRRGAMARDRVKDRRSAAAGRRGGAFRVTLTAKLAKGPSPCRRLNATPGCVG